MDNQKISYYNAEPVFYCTRCLSLMVRDIPNVPGTEYCGECNSTNIGTCSIEEWEELYKEKYGFKLLEKHSLKNKRKYGRD